MTGPENNYVKVGSKKELNQKIAETFANSKITAKSQYIRDLVDYNVKEDLSMVSSTDLKYIKNTIVTIDQRQVNGYNTFRNVEENQKAVIEKINCIRSWVIVLTIVDIFSLGSLFFIAH